MIFGDAVFIAVNVRDVTTTRGDDYSTRYDRQVQFNPGEFEKVWKLELINDSLYEIKVRYSDLHTYSGLSHQCRSASTVRFVEWKIPLANFLPNFRKLGDY